MRLSRPVIIAATAAAILAALTAWLLITPGGNGGRPAAGGGTAGGLILHSVDVGDILEISVTNKYGVYVISAEDGGFTVHDIPAPLVDYERFARMLASCAHVQASRLAVADTAAGGNVSGAALDGAMSDFGLYPASAAVRVSYGGSSYGFEIGAMEPVSGDYYFADSGVNAVYIMPSEYAEDFLLPLKSLVSHYATPPLNLSSPLSAVQDVTFGGEMFKTPLVLRSAAAGGEEVKRAALSFGAATHLVYYKDGVFKLDQTYGIEILGSLLGIPAADIAAYNLAPDEIDAYGFNSPLCEISFGLAGAPGGPPEEYILKIIRNAASDGSSFLLAVNGRGVVYVIPRLPFLDADAEKFISRWYLTPMLTDISGLTVTAPGIGLMLFEFIGETYGEKTAYLNGAEIDISAFRAFFNFITGASHDGLPLGESGYAAALEAAAGAEPLLSAEFFYNDPLKSPDTINFFGGEARKTLVTVNGRLSEFGMRELFVARALDACRAITVGEEFEVKW